MSFSEKLKRIIKNEYLYSVFTRCISITLAFLHSVITARYFGASLKGTSAYIISLTSVATIIVTFGIHQAYPYFRKKYGKDNMFSDFTTIVVTLYTLYLLIAIILAIFFMPTVELKIASILVPIQGYANVIGYLCLIENPNLRNKWWTIISVLNLCIVLFLSVFTKANIHFMVGVLIVEELLQCIVFTILVHPIIHFHKKLGSLFFELLKFGFFPMLALLLTTLNYKIDVFMLKSFDFITMAQIGVYSVGMTLADKIALIPDTLQGVLVSKLAKGADEQEVAKVSRVCFWSTMIVCFALLIVGKPFINILYGTEYKGAYEVILLCSFGSIFIGFFKLIAQYNIVNKKQIRNVCLLSLSIIVNVILNYTLIPKFQLSGAAFASGFGYFLSGWIFMIWFCKQNNIKVSRMFLFDKNEISALKKKIKVSKKR